MKPIIPLKLIKNIWQHLSDKRKYNLLVTIFVMLSAAISELISLTAALPFLYVISSKPEKIIEIKFLKYIYEIFGITKPEDFLIPVIISFIFFAALSGILRTLNLYLTTKLSATIGTDFSVKSYGILLNKPFYYYINENSSKTITSLTKYIDEYVAVIYAILEIFTGLFTSIFLIGGILFVNSYLALIALLIFGSAYYLLSKNINKILRRNSLEIANLQTKQVKTIQESVGSIRNIIMDNFQKYFTKNYFYIDYGMRNKMSQNQFLTYFPKSIFESVGLIFIAIISFLYSKNYLQNVDLVPVLGALAIGLQRLLPSLQKIYSSWASLKSYGEGANRILKILEDSRFNNCVKETKKDFSFHKKLVFEKVKFKYYASQSYVNSEINLEICKGDKIAIIGESGSGKSTFLDLIMGLLEPTKGKIFIDDKNLFLNNLVPYWQNIISHVPQEIFLADATVQENIAIGIPKEKIDLDRVSKCADLAKVSGFVKKLPNKYESVVGERGSKLSVGQKQRIGIARAFYKNAEILILDEATSALDSRTEEDILKTIKEINPNTTIIMVTHRLNTINKFEKIIKIDNGRVQYINKENI
ncbi:ABC transporter ATP-binding protein [Prochlorococcus marinus]|jgi:ABC-type bacteriocin/lantibiotic exporter with double-glycine peptidase domain|uniref:ABC transporter ATP-binding protein n=1 Tax=Prochlorococcus marinus (strain MIT 9301) TaxID=167546 RepID=A3PE71_PROM0|nr:ABC transporter ATP-binding protein [Prochlorococcus marinus]ABO18046.1 Hypothetical protein P9301_14231 [Prochlorococcus marinus str. MIT 9301]